MSNSKYDLTNNNAFVRKTDNAVNVIVRNNNGSALNTGFNTFYLTVRKSIPLTSQTDDNDSNVIIKKTITVTIAPDTLSLTITFNITQTELDIDPNLYFYDIKWDDTTGKTTPLLGGYARFEVVADITRRNP